MRCSFFPSFSWMWKMLMFLFSSFKMLLFFNSSGWAGSCCLKWRCKNFSLCKWMPEATCHPEPHASGALQLRRMFKEAPNMHLLICSHHGVVARSCSSGRQDDSMAFDVNIRAIMATKQTGKGQTALQWLLESNERVPSWSPSQDFSAALEEIRGTTDTVHRQVLCRICFCRKNHIQRNGSIFQQEYYSELWWNTPEAWTHIPYYSSGNNWIPCGPHHGRCFIEQVPWLPSRTKAWRPRLRKLAGGSCVLEKHWLRMEVEEAAVIHFSCSVSKHNFCYTTLVSYG